MSAVPDFATTADNTLIRYWVEGEGEPLFLISGLGGQASFWEEHRKKLSQQFRVISYDHRGAGQSDKSIMAYSIAQMAQDAIAVLEATGTKSAVVLGHSTGGCIATSLALDYPQRVRGLISSSSWAAPDAYFRQLFELRKFLLSLDIRAYIRSGLLLQYPPKWTVENENEVKSMERQLSHSNIEPGILSSKLDAILAFDRLAELANIGCPTLVTAASDDMIVPAHMSRQIADRIPKAEFSLIDGGHFCPRTNPEVFESEVAKFLERFKTAD